MNERVRIITEQALALPASERERLCEALLSRREAYKSGELSARPFEEILRERPAKGNCGSGSAGRS